MSGRKSQRALLPRRPDCLSRHDGKCPAAHALLSEMPTGARTPLSRGLLLAMEVIEAEEQKDRNALPLLVVLSDGRANVSMGSADSGSAAPGSRGGTSLLIAEARAMAAAIKEQHISAIVVDTESDFL